MYDGPKWKPSLNIDKPRHLAYTGRNPPAQRLSRKLAAHDPTGICRQEKELKKRTLTSLYNARPIWLDLAHKKLDRAVLAAYGWPDLMTDEGIVEEEELLARRLALKWCIR